MRMIPTNRMAPFMVNLAQIVTEFLGRNWALEEVMAQGRHALRFVVDQRSAMPR